MPMLQRMCMCPLMRLCSCTHVCKYVCEIEWRRKISLRAPTCNSLAFAILAWAFDGVDADLPVFANCEQTVLTSKNLALCCRLHSRDCICQSRNGPAKHAEARMCRALSKVDKDMTITSRKEDKNAARPISYDRRDFLQCKTMTPEGMQNLKSQQLTCNLRTGSGEEAGWQISHFLPTESQSSLSHQS